MKDPAFLFYPNDYIGGTMGMTFEEKGAYVELLMMQFNRGHMTYHMIGQTVGHLWDKLQDKFTQDENGLWYNKRLDEEKNKRKTYTESRRNNINGINQHTKKNKKIRSYDQSHDHAMTNHMEDINNSIDIVYNIFYDKELLLSNNDINYLNFIKVLFGQNTLSKRLDRVLKMQEQVTFEQFKTIYKYKEEYKITIGDYLVRMENWRDLNKKNTSVQLTLLDWIRRDKKK